MSGAHLKEKTESIAGHEFNLTRDAYCIKPRTPGSEEICGKLWAWIKHATSADVGKPDYPHTPSLTSHELSQIEARREREAAEDAAIWDAVIGVSSR